MNGYRKEREYLGDSIHAEFDDRVGVRLTKEISDGKEISICLDGEVMSNLFSWYTLALILRSLPIGRDSNE